MASLEECEGKLLLTLYRLKRLKEENPRIRKELEVLNKNVEDELLQLGGTMEQGEVADCAIKEEEAMMFEDVANMTTMEDELEVDQVGPRSYNLWTWMNEEEPHDDDDEGQGLLMVAGLVRVVCDLMVEGAKDLDKGGT